MSRGDLVVQFIETFLHIPEGSQVGQPLKLLPFQKKFIKDIYDNPHGTKRAYMACARKNGKSALIAALLLAHIVGPEARQNSQIISGARSRDQASLVFKLAEKMVRQSPGLQKIVRIVPSQKSLIGLPMNVEYRAISAEAGTAHGLSPVLAILDEVGQVRGPQDDFIDAIVTAQGAYNEALLIAISTQAPTDADLFSVWLDDAKRSKDKGIVSHVYAATEGAPVTDRKAWKAANPALGVFRSLPDLEQQAKEAERMPSKENTFRNLCLNQRISTVSPFISRNVWESCGGLPAEFDGLEIYGGLDLSARTDLTAFVAAGRDEFGIWHVHARFWAPQEGVMERSKVDRVPYDVWAREGYLTLTPGRTVDYSFVAQDLAEFLSTANVLTIGYDRWRIDLLKQEFDRIGLELPLTPFGQGFKDMSPALDVLESELLNGRMRHGLNPLLTMCAANAVVSKDAAGNRKLDKHKATGRIDGMVSLAMALGVASKAPEENMAIDDFLANPVGVD
jgi:phage terminase large subunit-like protein